MKDLERDGSQHIKTLLIQNTALILNFFAFESGDYLQQELMLLLLYLGKSI